MIISKEIVTATNNGVTTDWCIETTRYKNGKIKNIKAYWHIDLITSPTEDFNRPLTFKVINN